MARSAGVGDRGKGLVEPVWRGGQVPCRLGLNHHRRHVVGHDVVQLAGDPGTFRVAGALGQPQPPLRLGRTGLAQPGPGAPGNGHYQEERREPGNTLARSEPVEGEGEHHVRRAGQQQDQPTVTFHIGAGAQQRDGQRGARDGVIAAKLVDHEAERHQGEADG
nr:hypothetical protein GCM10020092_078770 [Actinoplanes digitatis]